MLGSVVLESGQCNPGSYLSAHGVPTGYAGEEIIGNMIFARLIWTLEIDGKPTLALRRSTAKLTIFAITNGCALSWASKKSMTSHCAAPTRA